MPELAESTSGEGLRRLSRLLRTLELPALLAMPVILALFLASDIRATAALTLACVLFVLALMLGSLELSRVGALAAFASNFFFGQGAWTPWQMYAWGLIGYLSAILAEKGLLDSKARMLAWGFASAILFGLIMDGMHIVGYVRPFTWQTSAAALLASLPLDCLHGVATVAFLALIWDPWCRQLKRVLAKYALG